MTQVIFFENMTLSFTVVYVHFVPGQNEELILVVLSPNYLTVAWW